MEGDDAMGLLDLFKNQPQTPIVQSILPDIAKEEIWKGRLPILNTGKIFLKAGEHCHYIEKAIYEKKTLRRQYVRKNAGYTMPGLFKGTRVRIGGGTTDQKELPEYQLIRGILYITNRRIIFQGEQEGFDLKIADLVAITPYNNCAELQTGKGHYRLFVPDGGLVQMVLQKVK